MSQVYVVSAVRTPVGKAPRGVFAKTRPDDLLAHTLNELLNEVPQLEREAIDDVIIGCAMPEGSQGMNVARMASLLAGLPDTVPGVTINRFCASGLESVARAADAIKSGRADLILAGGVESMSQVPMGGFHYSANPKLFANSDCLSMAYGMGLTAEIVADRYKVSREEQEAFAVSSHEKASAAIDAGYFHQEIKPFTVSLQTPDLATGDVVEISKLVEHDEGPRRELDLKKMASLKTVFARKGSVTAATSSQMSDGAGALLLASEQAVKRYELNPIGRFVDYQVVGVAPEVMGIGPIGAIKRLLERNKLKQADIDWIELNEAFAAQALAVIKQAELDPSKVNPSGGAIALGHPLGATGSIRSATLLHGLQRLGKRFGIVTMCIGTGMGAAGLFERIG